MGLIGKGLKREFTVCVQMLVLVLLSNIAYLFDELMSEFYLQASDYQQNCFRLLHCRTMQKIIFFILYKVSLASFLSYQASCEVAL